TRGLDGFVGETRAVLALAGLALAVDLAIEAGPLLRLLAAGEIGRAFGSAARCALFGGRLAGQVRRLAAGLGFDGDFERSVFGSVRREDVAARAEGLDVVFEIAGRAPDVRARQL